MKNIKPFIFLTILATLSLAAFPQGKGVIKGTVVNENNNEPVPFASLVILGTTIGSVSDLNGNFSFTGIVPGYVQIAVSTVGFDDYISEKFLVTNANTSFIDIPLAEKKVNLDEVVVKASPFRKKAESPVSLQRIGIEQIEKNPGGNRDISKVIQSLPGVSSGPSFRNDIIVRGGGPNENSFYIDGVEIPTINHFATQGASGGAVGIINVDFLREVNLYTGAFPVNMGNALSSVIDMRMVDGNKDKMKFKGSVGSSDLALTLNGPISDNTTFVVSARRSYLQFLFAVLGLPFLPKYNDFQFKVKTKLNEKNELTLLGIGAIDNYDLNLEANETTEQKYILNSLPVNRQWNYTLGAVYKHYRSRGYDTWIVSRNHLKNISYKYLDNDENNAKLLDYNSHEIENKFRFEKYIKYDNNLKFSFGAGAAYAQYQNQTKTSSFTDQGLVAIDYNTNLDMFHYNIFGQASNSFFKNRLSVSASIRADGSSYSEDMSNPFDNLSPRISTSYRLFPEISLNFNIGEYHQRPAYTSMGYKNGAGNLVNKNNGLKYIKNDQVVFGFDYQPGSQSYFSVEGFYKQYSDYPFSVADSVPLSTKGADFGTLGNEELAPISEGRAYGVELLGRAQNIFGVNVILSYTYFRSEFKDLRQQGAGGYISSSWDNKHLLNIVASKHFKRNWYVGFKWRFVGGTPYSPYDKEKSSIKEAWDINGGAYVDYSRFNAYRLAPFHQLDIRIDKEFFYDKWSLNLYLDIQNAYGFELKEQDVLTRKSFVEPGYDDVITGSGGAPDKYELVEFPSTTGTVLPSIGIIVQF